MTDPMTNAGYGMISAGAVPSLPLCPTFLVPKGYQ